MLRVLMNTFMLALARALRHRAAAQPASEMARALPFSAYSSTSSMAWAQRSIISMGTALAASRASSSTAARWACSSGVERGRP